MKLNYECIVDQDLADAAPFAPVEVWKSTFQMTAPFCVKCRKLKLQVISSQRFGWS